MGVCIIVSSVNMSYVYSVHLSCERGNEARTIILQLYQYFYSNTCKSKRQWVQSNKQPPPPPPARSDCAPRATRGWQYKPKDRLPHCPATARDTIASPMSSPCPTRPHGLNPQRRPRHQRVIPRALRAGRVRRGVGSRAGSAPQAQRPAARRESRRRKAV